MTLFQNQEKRKEREREDDENVNGFPKVILREVYCSVKVCRNRKQREIGRITVTGKKKSQLGILTSGFVTVVEGTAGLETWNTPMQPSTAERIEL